jgi:hypothetical protein
MSQPNSSHPSMTRRQSGGCHCGAVRFEVDLDLTLPVSRCNCTICTKLAATGAIVQPPAFSLLSSEADLSHYVWGPVAKRFFCSKCGVYCFSEGYLEQVGGDYVSVNVNCLDDVDVAELKVIYWDGRHDNWQAGPRDTPWPIKAQTESLQSAPAA